MCILLHWDTKLWGIQLPTQSLVIEQVGQRNTNVKQQPHLKFSSTVSSSTNSSLTLQINYSILIRKDIYLLENTMDQGQFSLNGSFEDQKLIFFFS